jgi:hypothetical protein
MRTQLARVPRQRRGIRLELRRGFPTLCKAGRELSVLNETAAALWVLCDGLTTPDEMVDAVCELCRIDEVSAWGDIDRTLTEFDRAGLIEWVRRG